MRINRLIAPLVAAAAAVTISAPAAKADLLVHIDKSSQRMTVAVDGRPLYRWPVSTGTRGYDTPSGRFRPFRMEIDHTSDEWDDAPMPYSIFFTKTGVAVHGTNERRSLGRAASHGCVRLSVKNAATLWSLVKREKMANTTVVVSGRIPGGAGPPAVARSAPLPPGANYPRYGAPPRYEPRYGGPPPRYEPRYDNDRPLLFPFFPFGR